MYIDRLVGLSGAMALAVGNTITAGNGGNGASGGNGGDGGGRGTGEAGDCVLGGCGGNGANGGLGGDGGLGAIGGVGPSYGVFDRDPTDAFFATLNQNDLGAGAPGIGGTGGGLDTAEPGADGESGARNWQ